jgi:hypothetical protein
VSADDGPFCPECGEPISGTADYCMHCYADLPSGGVETVDRVSSGEDAATTRTDTGGSGPETAQSEPATRSDTRDADDHGILDPEGTADNVLTVVAAIVGSIVIGFVGFIELLLATGSAWALPVGFFAWLGGLAYLARQYSVQETIGKTFYGASLVLLLLPLISLNPGLEGGIGDRVILFVTTLLFVAIPAGVFAGIGYGVLHFAPERN